MMFWVLAVVGTLGGCYAACVWLMSRFDSALAVTYRRPRR
mgnify:CR=1 FL=1